MTPQDVLLKAAEVIERDGWHQGYYYPQNFGDEAADTEANKHGPACAMGAIRRVI